jgi:purine-binding chemotaxis protein CheW
MKGGRLTLATEESWRHQPERRSTERAHAVLTFVVGGESYGIEIASIREIIKLRPITEVPRMPGFLLGVISVRGVIIPVLDLRRRLHLDETAFTRAARILVAEMRGEPFGLLCDAVTGVVRFADDDIEPTPSTLAVSDVAFLRGIARYQAGKRERMVALLALEPLVSFEIRGRK